MNLLVVSGRFVSDPVERKNVRGEKLATFSIAIYRKNMEPNFLDCIAFDELANFILESCKKGHYVILDGTLNIRKNTENPIYKSVNCFVKHLTLIKDERAQVKEDEKKKTSFYDDIDENDVWEKMRNL